MKLENVIITGDTHGIKNLLLRITNIQDKYPEVKAIIILGDAGINFHLDSYERHLKQRLNDCGVRIYCVRGNHEERPENLPFTINVHWDDSVNGNVYIESEFSNIRYFIDGGKYQIDGNDILTIGGAYSVDKEYRLERARVFNLIHSGWFPDEQLTKEEMEEIKRTTKDKKFDFIFSHTCPREFEPVDLFLPYINQDKVDKSMENFLDEIKDNCDWGAWAFGHFHASRRERPHVYQFYEAFMPLSSLKD